MKKLLIVLLILWGCSDSEPEPKSDVFHPCDIEATPPYYNGIEPDETDTYSDGRVVYTYNCIPLEWREENRSVIITWKFNTCWEYGLAEDNCK